MRYGNGFTTGLLLGLLLLALALCFCRVLVVLAYVYTAGCLFLHTLSICSQLTLTYSMSTMLGSPTAVAPRTRITHNYDEFRYSRVTQDPKYTVMTLYSVCACVPESLTGLQRKAQPAYTCLHLLTCSSTRHTLFRSADIMQSAKYAPPNPEFLTNNPGTAPCPSDHDAIPGHPRGRGSTWPRSGACRAPR